LSNRAHNGSGRVVKSKSRTAASAFDRLTFVPEIKNEHEVRDDKLLRSLKAGTTTRSSSVSSAYER
jgi:hypothetical protein